MRSPYLVFRTALGAAARAYGKLDLAVVFALGTSFTPGGQSHHWLVAGPGAHPEAVRASQPLPGISNRGSTDPGKYIPAASTGSCHFLPSSMPATSACDAFYDSP